MTLDPAEGLPAEPRAEPAANDDFTAIPVTPPPEPPKREPGWDSFEVWRTRVKEPANLRWAPYERDRRR